MQSGSRQPPLTSTWAQLTNQQDQSRVLSGASLTSSGSSSSSQSALAKRNSGPGSVSSSSSEQTAAASALIQSGPQLQQVATSISSTTCDSPLALEQPAEEQEDNRKLRLQLYVFVLRCISYPFNAKPTNTGDLHHKQQQIKLRKAQLEQIVQLHNRFVKASNSFSSSRSPHQHLSGLTATQLKELDELYERAHLRFNHKFLNNERMKLLVESECCSQQDLRELFRQNLDQVFKDSNIFEDRTHKRRVSPPAPSDGQHDDELAAGCWLLANKDVIMNSWLIKFESIIREESDGSSSPSQATGGELNSPPANGQVQHQLQLQIQLQQQPSKEQLYQMFQSILNIKKFEHQLLFNALQLDSSDEQAAAIRRELDGRISRIGELERNKKLLPKFVLKEMEILYLEESRMSVNKLMVNLDSLPVMRGSSGESRGVYGLHKFRRYNSRAQASLTRDGLVESHPTEPTLTKLDVLLTFNIEVIVMEARGLRHLAPTREIYCTMEIEGSERLQTEHVQAKKPLWDTQGDFTTSHPLPVLKIKLYAVNPSMLSLEDKELGKLVLRPTVLSPKTPEWCPMTASTVTSSSGSSCGQNQSGTGQDQELKLRVVVRMDRPQQLKHCGYLYGIGKSTWLKFKRRYHILIQVSQYTFVMCSYREKKSKPTEMLQLDGYTVDYIEPPTDLIMEHCSEMTSAEYHSSSSSSTLGLAGRLANVILKQPAGGASSASSGLGASGGDSMDQMGAGSGSGVESDGQQPTAIQTAAAMSDELHNKHYFNVVKEGDSVVFACDDEQECFGWVMALYRATGQAHKPTPLSNQYAGSTSHYLDQSFAYASSAGQSGKMMANSVGSSVGSAGGSSLSSISNGIKGTKSSVDVADQRARKHGMDEFISADPCKFQHNHLFKYLQNETLIYRLNDRFCSLGWFSPGQVLVLDEYCARYGVRTCFRHLAYLNSLLDLNQRGYFIDHTLLNYGYDFCASHVSGNSGQAHPMGSVNFDLRPDGVGTVTVEERDMFHAVRAKLLKMIERQIANFSHSFPFGKPDGALKATLSLLERLFMKEQQSNSMVQNDEVRNLIRKCLEQAALNNYTNLSDHANLLQPPFNGSTPPAAPSIAPASATQSGNQQPGVSSPDQQADNSGSQDKTPSTPLAAIGARLRTASNLSTSSVASYASSSLNSGSLSAAHSLSSGASDSMARKPRNPTAAGDQQKCLTMAMIINNDQVKLADKLRHLIRLAELCCEQVEENNEYFSDAFAWHSDLMMDHFELFWSLFSVDMDKILNELNGTQGHLHGSANVTSGSSQQPNSLGSISMRSSTGGSLSGPSGSDLLGATNREAFSLFQVLNNHLRKSPNLECRKFKAHLCDTFKPRLLRYIDIMESTLTRMLFKAFEKDGQVSCFMIEQMFGRLDELQKFVLIHLRWPDNQLADQLNQRLKLMAYELCDACVQRTLLAFQQLERKSNKWTATTTSYVTPVDMIGMINLVLDTRIRAQTLCTFNNFDQMSYNSKIDKLVESALAEMQPLLMAKMLNALDSTLTKLARYDEGNLLAPILSLTTKQGMSSSGRDIGKQYVTFVSNCCDSLRHKINDELWIVNLLEDWYATQMNIICCWLGERIDHSLHDVQLLALTNIMPKIYADMSLQGVSEDKLNLKTQQTIMSRLKMEEAAAMAGGSLFEHPSTSIFNSSILSSLNSSSTSSSQLTSSGQATPQRQASQQQLQMQPQSQSQQQSGGQQSQSRPLDSPNLQARRIQTLTGQQQATGANDPVAGDNIADRALQSATRMFKGFWAN